MRYELDDNGYVLNVFWGCNSGNCTAYTGTVPEGYTDLIDWSENAIINAYYIKSRNLTLDAERLAELEAKIEQETIDNAPVVHKELVDATSPTLLANGTNLTDITTPGSYIGNDASNYSNCPVTNGSFTLEVTKTAEGIVKQLFHKHRENTGDMNWFSYASFERCYTTNWTPWSCTSGYINAYNSSGSPGWYRVLTLGSTSPYVNTGGVLTINSSGSKPGDIVGTIMFSYYNNAEYSFKILNGNIHLSDIKAVRKSDNSIDICIRTNYNYEILMVGIDTLTSYTAFNVSPAYLGNSLPTGTQISFSDVSGWIDMSFVNGWYNHSNDYSLGQYKKVGNQVFLRGFIRGGTNDLVTTLPEGYRPARSFYDVYVKDNNVFGTVIVDKSGRVSLWGYASNSWNSFNLSFFID